MVYFSSGSLSGYCMITTKITIYSEFRKTGEDSSKNKNTPRREYFHPGRVLGVGENLNLFFRL